MFVSSSQDRCRKEFSRENNERPACFSILLFSFSSTSFCPSLSRKGGDVERETAMQADTMMMMMMTDEKEERKEMILPKRHFCFPFSFPVSP